MQDGGGATTYRRLGSGATGNFLRDRILYIISVSGTFILFLLFVLWILILLFLINLDVNTINDKENTLSSSINSYIVSHPGDGYYGDGSYYYYYGDGDGDGNYYYYGDGDGDGDGYYYYGDGDGDGTGGGTNVEIFNTYITNNLER